MMGPGGADSEVLAKSPGRDPVYDGGDNPDGDDHHRVPDHPSEMIAPGNALEHSLHHSAYAFVTGHAFYHSMLLIMIYE